MDNVKEKNTHLNEWTITLLFIHCFLLFISFFIYLLTLTLSYPAFNLFISFTFIPTQLQRTKNKKKLFHPITSLKNIENYFLGFNILISNTHTHTHTHTHIYICEGSRKKYNPNRWIYHDVKSTITFRL